MKRILLIGDYSDSVIAHGAIPKALFLAFKELPLGCEGSEWALVSESPLAIAHMDLGGFEIEWVKTREVSGIESLASKYPTGIWCVPGSPYESMDGALTAIRFARENGIPFLGTCGGFQHALIEYARNVLGIGHADHAESSPDATEPVIAKLRCSMINQSESISLKEGSRLREIYGTPQITEAYQCSYGVNPDFEKRLNDGKLAFTAFSWDGMARAFELKGHPFFIGTLFQPERSAASGEAHPVITAFLKAALTNRFS